MTRLALLAAGLLLWQGCSRPPRVPDGGTAARAPVARPEVVRDEAGRRMDQYLEAAQRFGFSGAVLVADPRGIVLRRGYGPADARRRISPDMMFDMGSITKQFTAAAILLLEEQGRLATTDPLSRFFPEAPVDKRDITLHQLLTHTSGLISDFADDYAQMSRDAAVSAIFAAPLVSPPGKEFNYSNAGFSLLAILIERITGRPYDNFMEERIYHSIGMHHTGYAPRALDPTLVAHSYTPPVDHGTPAERLRRAGGPGWNLMGNGGVLTTVDDMYLYDRALGAGEPISPAIQAKQFAEQFRHSPTRANGYGWEIEAAGDDGIIHHHAGDGPATGVSGEYRRYPRDSTVFILLANNRHHGGSTRRYVIPNLRRLYLGTATLQPPSVQGAPDAALDEIAGRYVVDSASSFMVERMGDHFALTAVGQAAVNVMVFNREPSSVQSRESFNQKALALVRALASEDEAALRAAFGPQADLEPALAWWRDMVSRLGAFQDVESLGTDRMDRNVFQSTVRVSFRDGARTLRWTWQNSIPTRSSEDEYLPGAFAFGAESPVEGGAWSPYWWLEGKDSLVTYDLKFDQTLAASIVRAADGTPGELVFHVPTGEVRAVRADARRLQPGSDVWNPLRMDRLRRSCAPE